MALRFLHIPKTAGSTFTDILRLQYRGKGHFSFSGNVKSDIDRFQALSAAERKKVELFTGHAPISTGLPDADDAIIITFLREPIDRVKSFCQHVAEGKSPHLRRDFPPARFNLDRFLESGEGELSNLQTKMLINSGHCTSAAFLESMSILEARNLALANLTTKVSHFGLREFFDESVINFSQSLGWLIAPYGSRNRKDSSKLVEFSGHHLDRIAELNSVDIEVYKAARARFLDVMESAKIGKSKLGLLRSANVFTSFGLNIRSRIKRLIADRT